MKKYEKLYYKIIKNAKNRKYINGYTEKHHIIPRSMGGNNSLDNLVNLTAREHFICHVLLTKFITGENYFKMVKAVIIMKSSNKSQNRYFNSKLYEKIRIEYSNYQKEKVLGVLNPFYGKKHSLETKKKLSEFKKKNNFIPWNKGVPRTEQERKNISISKTGKPSTKKGKPGKKLSEESKKKMSEKRKGNYYWWNNGITNKRQIESPGENYIRGRLVK